MKIKVKDIYYTKIYHNLIKDWGLSWGEYIVIDVIRILSADPNHNYRCIYTNKELSDRCSEPASTVERALIKARKLKFIERGHGLKKITVLWKDLERKAEKEGSTYTIIPYNAKKELNLTNHEYAVIDTIDQLSKDRKYGYFCVLTQKNIGEKLNISQSTVARIIKKAKKLDYVYGVYSKIKTTELWNKLVYTHFRKKKESGRVKNALDRKNIFNSF